MANPADIAASLTMEDIPVKLRCATCNKLANNAFRMPCCDQSICEDCQASLPEACPVCYHEPVKPDDCRPNKALRTTIKVFLKKKIVERETAEKKRLAAEKAATTPVTPVVEETPARQPSQAPGAIVPDASLSATIEANPVLRDISQAPQTPGESKPVPGSGTPTEAQKDVPQESIESPGPDVIRRASTQTVGEGSGGQERENESEKQTEQQQASGHNQQWHANNGFDQGINNGAFGFDGSTGAFPNIGLNGMVDYSQMMHLMPNGIPNTLMGSFPNMIGMSGMNMDPMAISQMYSGFGGQGMGINNMNMGVGFDAGQGAFGGFNGQSAAWNAGQNKFNQNAYGNHSGMGAMGGDYGTNTGYGGYNVPPHQGNYNQMHQHQYPNNDFHQGHHGQGFQSRGRGRGRGYFNAGRGRGGYNHYNQYNQPQGNQANNEAFHQQLPETTRRGSPSYGPQVERPPQQPDNEGQEGAKAEESTNNLTAEEQLNKELDPGGANDNDEASNNAVSKERPKDEPIPERTVPALLETDSKTPEKSETEPTSKEEGKPEPIQTFISDEVSKAEAPSAENEGTGPPTMPPPPSPMIPTGPASFHTNSSHDVSPRGRGISRGYSRGVDYRAGSHGRGSGYLANGSINHVQSTPPVTKPIVPPAAPKGLGVEGAPKAPKALREGQPNIGIRGFSIVGRASAATQARPNGVVSTKRSPSRERSRSRSPHRHQSSHHRHHRHRSASPSSSPEREKRRERRHRHSRRHEAEDSDDHREAKTSRTREASAGSSTKRSSHRSRRHHDEDRDKDAERVGHRSHRSHKDRSREREREERESKKREKSPELVINGASRRSGANLPTSSRHKDDEDAPPSSSRKRRSEDEDDYREHKRKRRVEDETLDDRDATRGKEKEKEHSNGHRASRPSRREATSKDLKENNPGKLPPPQEKSLPKDIPKGPKQDNNSMLSEREKYAAERIARENQRRLSQMGGSGGSGGGKVGRRISHHKYEDDETILKGESEREALRYR